MTVVPSIKYRPNEVDGPTDGIPYEVGSQTAIEAGKMSFILEDGSCNGNGVTPV